nr:2OG-Fe dioxygenase family protein [Photobacterium leiognathi]
MNIVNGAKFISGNEYLNESINRCKEESEILVLFNDTVKEDPNSGVRKRAYIKVDFNLNDDSICLSKDQTYFQDASSNNLDGGTRRTFTAIHPQFLETDFLIT